MENNETPLIMKYWNKTGGTLILEYPVVKKTKTNSPRYIDAIIIPNEETKIKNWQEVSLENKDIICIQAKNSRLGMYLMGQALFSYELLKPFKPKSIKSIALCRQDDSVLKPMLEKYPNIKVEIID